MKSIEIKSPGGLDKLVLVDRPEPRDPGPGEIKVRIRAGSLNYHDYVVVIAKDVLQAALRNGREQQPRGLTRALARARILVTRLEEATY